jgi:taurine dioxygenase/sulfonate dioxygenase
MAPSVAEIPEKQEASSIIVPVKATTGTGETAPKVRRIIEEEEGKTPASVSFNP